MMLTAPKMAFVDALLCKHTQSVTLLDANADLDLPLYEKIVGRKLGAENYMKFAVEDGAPIERVLVRCKLTKGMVASKVNGLRLAPVIPVLHHLATEIEKRKPALTGLITFAALETALLACLPQDTLTPAQRDRVRALPAASLKEIETSGLREVLARCKTQWAMGHYGAIRSLDDWKPCDMLVTMGDPWMQLEQARHDAAFLDIEDWEERYQALAVAELEQATNRIRPVWRDRPATVLHYGRLVPGGTGWLKHSEIALPAAGAVGRASASEVRADRLLLGMSMRQYATYLGVELRYLAQVEAGERPASDEITKLIR